MEHVISAASPTAAAAKLTAPNGVNSLNPGSRVSAISRVLVCLDRSAPSDASLPYARFVAEVFSSQVTLLHVVPSAALAHEPNRADALECEIAKREAQQYLVRSANTLGVGHGGTLTRVTQGFPAERIVAAAHELGADLTILSSHGSGGRTGPDVGSIAQQVLALGAGSVLLTSAPGRARMPPHRILVPLDGSLRGESVLPIVAQMARHCRAEVWLVHVVAEPTPTALLAEPSDMRLAMSLASRVQANAASYLARIRTRLMSEVPVVQTLVLRRTEERQALLDVAAENAMDMVVVTAHGGACNPQRSFGSVASYLLAHSTLPIFVMQDMPRDVHASAGDKVPRATFSSRPPEGG